MIGLDALCKQKTRLSQTDIDRLHRLAESLQSIADLNGCDAFIDCLDVNGVAFVAAQSNPRFYASRYVGNVVGQAALRENEPAVYHCFERGVPVHDTRATTQENAVVQQDVTPIENDRGQIVGVMISERDVSREANLERRLDVSERERQELFRQVIAKEESRCAPEQATVLAREAYHRIKNDLQMIASICNVRMRQATEEETRLRLYEMRQMILTVASLHDVLTVWEAKDENGTISLKVLLSETFKRIRELFPDEKDITLIDACDEIEARPARAMTVALVITELVTNAVNHAFPDGRGTIRVEVHADASRCSAVVSDDGTGIHGDVRNSHGLNLVMSLVQDKLEGTFSIASSEAGTAATFTFLP